MATYAAMVDIMNQSIGRLMRALERLGIADDTLVLFMSDNGGCAENIGKKSDAVPATPESFMGYHLPWANVSNTPFRPYKHWAHEGGIATLHVAHWPSGVQAEPGSVTHQVGHIVDIMATAVDVAGTAYPGSYNGRSITPLEGKSLKPIFEGRSRPGHSMLFWSTKGTGPSAKDGGSSPPGATLRGNSARSTATTGHSSPTVFAGRSTTWKRTGQSSTTLLCSARRR
jgi:arylsulfatase